MPTEPNDARPRIRRFVVATFLFDDADALPADDDSLLEHGVVDSLGVLDLIVFLEDEFGLSVPDEDVVPEHFDSVAALAAYVAARRAVAAG